jgi:hypothetical protein
MKTSESIKEISSAISKAQDQIPSVHKNTKVEFKQVKYKFAPLHDYLVAIKKPLLDNDLTLIQMPIKGGLCSRLVHNSSGEWIEENASIENLPSQPQLYGQVISYMRRYSIMAMFMIDQEDDDCQSVVKNEDDIKEIRTLISSKFDDCVKENHNFSNPKSSYLSGDLAQLKRYLNGIEDIYNGIIESKGSSK